VGAPRQGKAAGQVRRRLIHVAHHKSDVPAPVPKRVIQIVHDCLINPFSSFP
jgi:hypothetical protein